MVENDIDTSRKDRTTWRSFPIRRFVGDGLLD